MTKHKAHERYVMFGGNLYGLLGVATTRAAIEKIARKHCKAGEDYALFQLTGRRTGFYIKLAASRAQTAYEFGGEYWQSGEARPYYWNWTAAQWRMHCGFVDVKPTKRGRAGKGTYALTME